MNPKGSTRRTIAFRAVSATCRRSERGIVRFDLGDYRLSCLDGVADVEGGPTEASAEDRRVDRLNLM